MKFGSLIFSGFLLLASLFFGLFGPVNPLFASDTEVKILFIGDSISSGLGVEPEYAYPSVLNDLLEEKEVANVNITNGSISGSTTAGAFSRLKWFLRAKPDVLVLALGANDGLRGLSTDEMSRNLEKAIVLAQEKGIKVILAGMMVPPNYGPEYSKAFYEVFIFLADKYKVSFVPFLLKDVAGNPSLNQADGIHPNRDGHKIIAANILPYVLEQL
jgi:acyl-CoA thioesterase-1